MAESKLRIGVLASGQGTTLQAVIDACEVGNLDASVVAVTSNNSQSGAATRAKRYSIPFAHLSGRTHPNANELDAAIRDVFLGHSTDLVLLAGYMKKLGPATMSAFVGRIVNTHPALLPKYGGKGMYGSNVQAAVLAAHEKMTGISVHLVDDEYDTGRVLAQQTVPVEPGDDVDSLTERVQRSEKEFLVEVLQRIASGEIIL